MTPVRDMSRYFHQEHPGFIDSLNPALQKFSLPEVMAFIAWVRNEKPQEVVVYEAIEAQAKERGWDQESSELARMLSEETQELVDAVQEALVTGDVYTVASEIGDVLYVTYRMCQELGINPTEAIAIKVARNEAKFKPGVDREQARAEWSKQGGDQMWLQTYLQLTAEEDE